MNCLIELHYLPSIAWFAATQPFDTITLEKHEHFVKQSYRSRCRIVTSQGIQELTVPLTGKHGKTLIKDIRIDHRQKWVNNHWRSIVSAYNNAPFFEYYSDALHDTLYKEHTFLFDLNLEDASELVGNTLDIIEDDHVCIVRSSYNQIQRLKRYDVTMFQLELEHWQRTDLTLFQRYHTVNEVLGALADAGFFRVKTYDARREFGFTISDGRMFYLARK